MRKAIRHKTGSVSMNEQRGYKFSLHTHLRVRSNLLLNRIQRNNEVCFIKQSEE